MGAWEMCLPAHSASSRCYSESASCLSPPFPLLYAAFTSSQGPGRGVMALGPSFSFRRVDIDRGLLVNARGRPPHSPVGTPTPIRTRPLASLMRTSVSPTRLSVSPTWTLVSPMLPLVSPPAPPLVPRPASTCTSANSPRTPANSTRTLAGPMRTHAKARPYAHVGQLHAHIRQLHAHVRQPCARARQPSRARPVHARQPYAPAYPIAGAHHHPRHHPASPPSVSHQAHLRVRQPHALAHAHTRPGPRARPPGLTRTSASPMRPPAICERPPPRASPGHPHARLAAHARPPAPSSHAGSTPCMLPHPVSPTHACILMCRRSIITIVDLYLARGIPGSFALPGCFIWDRGGHAGGRVRLAYVACNASVPPVHAQLRAVCFRFLAGQLRAVQIRFIVLEAEMPILRMGKLR
ncbi:hypothetical protein FIBSPDRAFT_1017480 [Athelia psychrophila]|uniref:Uncharacterized protein n=1 Tax=Athelia psychrophila TaxID=1759441 RepID=A0A166VER5_9AGAM|nr:hypothetical protein FIBSPDRAFT_1017480 [Fibularhizoctonia sp. CBS 109695]